MRIVSYGSPGAWRPGIETRGHVASLAETARLAGWSAGEAAALTSTRALLAHPMERIAELGAVAEDAHEELASRGALHPREVLRIGPPVPDPEKIVCFGLNYHDHAAEMGSPIPEEPLFFAKFANSLAGPADDIVPPPHTAKVDYEAELAVVIGKPGRHIAEADALSHVAGAMVLNDVSARDLQMANPLWIGGKAIDGFAPCGPALTLASAAGDLGALGIRTRVNGETRQESTTAQFIFPVARLVAFLSRIMTLVPGDIIATGTPPGVAAGMKPPRFLEPGDVVECEVDGLGTLVNRVAPPA